MSQNRHWKLIARPSGHVKRSDFEFSTSPTVAPGPGQVAIEVQYISLDPAMRGWMNDVKSYVPPVKLGDVMRALGAGKVVASNDPKPAVGDFASGATGVQSHVVGDAKMFSKVDPQVAPLPRWLGVLGMPGVTAYFGLLDIGEPREGDTVVISGAAGAVGAVA